VVLAELLKKRFVGVAGILEKAEKAEIQGSGLS
jgi:hypothetical protein